MRFGGEQRRAFTMFATVVRPSQAVIIGRPPERLGAQPAWAHGIAGNRFFPGAMLFDDPAVADEFLLVPAVRKYPSDSTTGSTCWIRQHPDRSFACSPRDCDWHRQRQISVLVGDL
jgi:hypothetical protein